MEEQIYTSISTTADNKILAKISIKPTSEPILGTAFHVIYDAQYLEYQSYSAGDFFEQNQQEPIYLIKNEEGKIYSGISLRRDQTMVSGEGTLVYLYFKPIKEGKTILNFEKTHLSTLEDGHRKILTSEWKDENFVVNNVFQADFKDLLTILLVVLAFITLVCLGVFVKNMRQKLRRNKLSARLKSENNRVK